jgi:hypothetical protein
MGEGGGIQSTTRIQKTKNKQNKFFVRYQDLSRAIVALKSHCGSQEPVWLSRYFFMETKN